MRKTSLFYKDLHALRNQYGETEYSREDILPATMALLERHGCSREDLLRDAATTTLNSIESAEDRAGADGQGEFDYGAHVALGNTKRIRRGFMNLECLMRRERLIDDNKAAQDRAWQREKAWNRRCIDALAGHTIETVVQDVLPAEVAEKALA